MRLFKAIRYSAVGVFFAGVLSAIQGCQLSELLSLCQKNSEACGLIFFLLSLQLCAGPLSEETESVAPIVMFSAGTHNGNLAGSAIATPPFTAGRGGADNLCVAAKPAGVTGTNVRAFISVTADDEIRDMPTNFSVPKTLPIVGPTGIKIAENWDDLFDHSSDFLLASLRDAEVPVSPTTANWWTGSGSSGELSTFNCTGWTKGVIGSGSGFGGRRARVSERDETWINSGSNSSCITDTIEVMCISF